MEPRIVAFPPLACPDASVLVLGTMPSVASLDARQYYAHPRNAFWPIMGELLEFDATAPYRERCHALTAGGVALWDVLASCEREGSLDSAIRAEVPNDIGTFLAAHPKIRAILFNGQPASRLWRKHCRILDVTRFESHTLPSTSPAHAGKNYAEKLQEWRSCVMRFVGIEVKGVNAEPVERQ